MRWWFVTFQALILAAAAIAAGLVHASISPERSRIEDFLPTWHRQAARQAETRITARTNPPDQPIARVVSNSDGNNSENPGTNNPGAGNPGHNNDPDNPGHASNPGQNTDSSNDNNDNTETVDNGSDEAPAANDPAAIDLASLPAEIGLAEAKALWDDGQAVFVDARTYKEYKEGHIEYAIAIPYNMIRELTGLPPHVREGVIDPASTTLVVYCIGGNCDESLLVAQELRGIGFKCHLYLDGYPAWRDAGYPTSEGPDEFLVAFQAEPGGDGH